MAITPLLIGLFEKLFHLHDPHVIPLKGPGSNGINNALTMRVNENPLDHFPQCISNENFLIYHSYRVFPEDFTKVTIFGKMCMIYCHIFINIPFMMLEPIAIFHTRLPYPTFGHILYISKTAGNTTHQEINATYLPVY